MKWKRASMEAAMDLLRRMPPSLLQQALDSLLALLPAHSSELLPQSDQPLQVAWDEEHDKHYLLCDYNRDGDSYRSPWSSKYKPELEDGVQPSAKLRTLEQEANEVFSIYRDQYYEGGISSVYVWELEDGKGFAACVLIKKVAAPFVPTLISASSAPCCFRSPPPRAVASKTTCSATADLAFAVDPGRPPSFHRPGLRHLLQIPLPITIQILLRAALYQLKHFNRPHSPLIRRFRVLCHSVHNLSSFAAPLPQEWSCKSIGIRRTIHKSSSALEHNLGNKNSSLFLIHFACLRCNVKLLVDNKLTENQELIDMTSPDKATDAIVILDISLSKSCHFDTHFLVVRS